ncbi:MAG TPA: C4-dicarboxylate transporter DctA [Candidatus Limnocylindria bacterium]|jgi:aerobic C4-dicarboxylate transport protein|nr:C4-dicarboxylate transporter DctA [Candidatus Limnocylindria bacterium]
MLRILKTLYVQVLVAIVIGAVLGHFYPSQGEAFKPLADGFIKLIKAMVGPLIFLTLVNGIGGAGDLKKVGRVGIKALIYFEVATTLALALGLVVVNVVQPGAGLHADPKTLSTAGIQTYATAAKHFTFTEFMLNLIPDTFVGAFDKGDILPILLLAILTGVSLSQMGQRGKAILDLSHGLCNVFMGIIGIVMRLAPLAAFGAMFFLVAKYGPGTLVSLGKLLGCVYATCGLFVFLVLGGILRLNGFRLLPLLRHIREEILLVIGTSSSETALPRLLQTLEKAGCTKSVVGLVLPAGYSFNLDGTCIYLTMAAVFIGQATDTPMTLIDQLKILGILLLTSKGAAAVTGGGFVTLNATLAASGPLPVSGLTLLIGIDRFMSEIRAVTNLIGNSVATLVIAKWEGELVETEALKKLRGES